MTDDAAACSAARVVDLYSPSLVHAAASSWYALLVASNRAYKVRDALRDLGFDEFLPTYTEVARWSDRAKPVTRLLFPGYIFARLDVRAVPEVLQLPGVVRVLPNALSPAAVSDAEITNLQLALASRLPVAPCAYVAGQAVTISSGPLAGVSGVVVGQKDELRIVVGIEMLGRAVQVQIDTADLERT